MRSKLFVPGGRPELFAKALAGDADALSLDLEDAVAEAAKPAARAAVSAFLQSAPAATTTKLLIVRSNAPDSPHFADDLAALAWPALGLLNLPKVDSVDQLRHAIRAIEEAERRRGLEQPMRLLVNVETPAGLRAAAQIASADPRVAGLQLGLGDLFAPHGIARTPANVHAAQFALRMAAAEAGVFALDGAYPGIDDAAGFEAEARSAHDLGYLGKSCIHPRQVALANRAFAPSQAELAQARRVVEAAEAATREGVGAFTVDGRMVDLPYLRRAQALLASAAAHP